MFVRLIRGHRLVALEALAELVLPRHTRAHQQVERAVQGRRPHGAAALGHAPRHFLDRQMLARLEQRLRHREPLVRGGQVVVPQVAAKRLQQLARVNLHTTPRAPPLPAAPAHPSGRRRPASPATPLPPATGRPPPPPPSPAPVPCRAPPACTWPCRRAAGRRDRAASPPRYPTPGPRASAAGTGRSCRSPPAAPAPGRPQPACPTRGPALAGD